ncbi:hypothetical protein EBA29_02628 [Bacillus velezensis]|uniref:Uncharacterized protein n=1 Tax=Bacillus amyloliquefaciens (strain Y2) TaxID=1155777 RepID=I2C8E6_BACAY|nr:hypothetical protein MUS_3028 [Bacillus velezensis YAU B9601-Y2]AHZ16788.1 hypothetical protein V529_27620 [Bacillus velezensis SQR9]ANF37484.1 hypothetical protein BCBMB205_25900 [Bacillus velezensis]EIF14083.1 hypothetical protein MY7_2417 [Bacillus sp. 5B6]GFR55786.1 hypothetical protein MY7_2417 [Bacillus sp. CN2]
MGTGCLAEGSLFFQAALNLKPAFAIMTYAYIINHHCKNM